MLLYLNQIADNSERHKFFKGTFLTVPCVIYTVKNFYLLNEFDNAIGALKDAGLIEYWNSKYIDERILKFKKPKAPEVLNLLQFQGCFIILVFGFVASFFMFLFEIIFSKCT